MIYVAKSYQNLPILGEPFEQFGRMYVKVQMKNGNEKIVRSYTEKEYNKMYSVKIINTQSKSKFYKSQKEVLGFSDGYIWIFKGVNAKNEKWFDNSPCRACRLWGWYLPSNLQIPQDLPLNLKPVKLYWESIEGEKDQLTSDEKAIKRHIASILNAAI